MLDRWLSYIVTIIWEFTWAYSVLVVLGKCSSYRGGRLNRFDCIYKSFITLQLDYGDLVYDQAYKHFIKTLNQFKTIKRILQRKTRARV